VTASVPVALSVTAALTDKLLTTASKPVADSCMSTKNV
jgi:hypothetical protein